MKKIILSMGVFFSIFSVSFAEQVEALPVSVDVENQTAAVNLEVETENKVDETDLTATDDQVIIEDSEIELLDDSVASGEKMSGLEFEPVDPEAAKNYSYLYYYGDGCSHCADLDVFLKKYGAYEKLELEKKEIWKVEENRELYLKDAERLLQNPENAGTPFVIVNTGEKEIPLIGRDTVESFLAPVLGDEIAPSYIEEKSEAQNQKMIVLAILLLIAVGIPAALYFFGKK